MAEKRDVQKDHAYEKAESRSRYFQGCGIILFISFIIGVINYCIYTFPFIPTGFWPAFVVIVGFVILLILGPSYAFLFYEMGTMTSEAYSNRLETSKRIESLENKIAELEKRLNGTSIQQEVSPVTIEEKSLEKEEDPIKTVKEERAQIIFKEGEINVGQKVVVVENYDGVERGSTGEVTNIVYMYGRKAFSIKFDKTGETMNIPESFVKLS